jgi:hypothetical protein
MFHPIYGKLFTTLLGALIVCGTVLAQQQWLDCPYTCCDNAKVKCNTSQCICPEAANQPTCEGLASRTMGSFDNVWTAVARYVAGPTTVRLNSHFDQHCGGEWIHNVVKCTWNGTRCVCPVLNPDPPEVWQATGIPLARFTCGNCN